MATRERMDERPALSREQARQRLMESMEDVAAVMQESIRVQGNLRLLYEALLKEEAPEFEAPRLSRAG